VGKRERKEIDNYPSAWCAIEMAVLDILAREKGCSVEKLLGITCGNRYSRYTAVWVIKDHGHTPLWLINI